MKAFFYLAALIFSLTTSLAYAELDIENPMVPEAPPTAKVLTAYMKLHNKADRPQTVVSISSPQFKKIEMHKTEIVDDIASMILLQYIRIQPGEMVELKSGGIHLMMYQPSASYTEGDCIKLVVSFDNGETQTVRAQVKKRTPMEDHSHHHHH